MERTTFECQNVIIAGTFTKNHIFIIAIFAIENLVAEIFGDGGGGSWQIVVRRTDTTLEKKLGRQTR
uniref:Uncharacterized protein n=1 Tax=Romanomermis culicivorax TaxID=13658 RepID=A0A915LAD3_ROMCU